MTTGQGREYLPSNVSDPNTWLVYIECNVTPNALWNIQYIVTVQYENHVSWFDKIQPFLQQKETI